ncbi:MAG: hypothetical protein KDK70_04120 [Myxococcales bacterium]|nr:hypothetical protein [Myxococcales bacterium]
MNRPRRCALVLASTLALPLACDKDEAKTSPEAEAPASSSSASSSSSSSSSRSAAASLPSLSLPKAVPASAAGVLVLRTPESLFATVAGFDLFGEPDAGDTKALREELDEYLRSRIGVTLTEVDTVTVFMDPKAGVAAIIEGADGTPKGRSVGEHEGVTLLALGKAGGDDEGVAAQHGKLLLVGQTAAVELALSAAADGDKRLERGPLVDLLTDDSKGVALAAAVEVESLPEDLRRELAGFGVDRALLRYGAEGLRAVAMGSEESMTKLEGMVTGGLTALTSEAENTKRQALEGDDTITGAGAIYASYSAQRLRKLLVPKREGGTLTLELPIRLQDPTLLAAVAGIGAAIAVPALTKYMRRSKTSEARVQIAKMFDAASAYFNEEHVSRGAIAILGGEGALPVTAPHQCPNDSREVGSAGITPPLSVNCNEGPGGRCVPVAGTPTGPGEYSMSLWTDNPVWNGLNFQMEQGHYFHYDFQWNNGTTGFGSCQFTAQAFGDLDDDGVFSTYERTGAADELGVNAAAGLYIDREVE